jgi:hypothetical protein
MVQDDIEVGTLFTVTQGLMMGGRADPFTGIAVAVFHDRSFNGSVMEVIAVNLPFVVAKIVADKNGGLPPPWMASPMSFAIREYKICRVDAAYMNALLKGERSTKDTTP